jgi:hypothetical protein
MNREGYEKKEEQLILKYYYSIFLDWLKKIMDPSVWILSLQV